MVRKKNKKQLAWAGAGLLLLLASAPGLRAQADPPSRVARLSYINGNVSMQPAGVDDWVPAELNRPFTIGDYLYADQSGSAELHLDVAAIRMGAQSSFGFLNLDDRSVQLKMTEGDLYVRLHNFGTDQVFEVDTPNAAVTLLRDGIYRFRVDGNGSMTFVVVREGQAEVTGGGQAFTLNPDNSVTLTGTDQLSYNVELAPQPDEFDQWCQQRDAHEAERASARYLPPTVIGSEDLDDYGAWQDSGEYGAVWYPRNVDPGWAPYHVGHWAWIDPWGWTWIDGMPWGFAPFHYGRWVYFGSRWGWCPGPISVGYRGPVIRPYYAPAMVAWFGGEHWGVGISVGGGPSLGWVPLGWGEVYTPSYHCSPRYFNNVNEYNTRIVNNVNITNVYNTVYVNKQVYNQQYVNVRAPNAVMAMSHSAFASGRPVQQAAVPVRQAEFARAGNAAVIAPQVAPTRQSFVATSSNRVAPRPPAQVVQRPVVARNTPPPAPASFAERQPYLARQAGQPFNAQTVRSSLPPAATARPAVASVRPAPPATPVNVRPGQRVGTAAAEVNRPAQQPTRPAPQPAQQAERPAGQPAGQYQQQRPEPRTGVSGPAEPQPAPAAHGVPPNMRQQQPANQAPASGRYNNEPSQGNGRFPPPANNSQRPAPPNAGQPARPTEPQNTGRYNQPAPAQTREPQAQPQQPANRQPEYRQPAPQERPAPVRSEPEPQQRNTSRPAPPPQTREPQAQPENRQPAYRQPAPQERAQPAAPAERRGYPERGAEPPREERSQPQPQHESRPAPSSHEEHGKPDHKNK